MCRSYTPERAGSNIVRALAGVDIDEGRPRFRPDREHQRELTRRFLAAVEDGDVDVLVEFLAADVVFYGDGGGRGRGLPRPVYGRNRVARLSARSVRNSPSSDAVTDPRA
jgi:hypothetical protein